MNVYLIGQAGAWPEALQADTLAEDDFSLSESSLEELETLLEVSSDPAIIVLGCNGGCHDVIAQAIDISNAHEDVGVLVCLSSDATSDWSALVPEGGCAIVANTAGVEETRYRLRQALAIARLRRRAMIGEKRLRLTRNRIEALAMVDMDTGLYNRRYLVARLREALAAAERYERPLALVVVSLTGLESMPDAFETDGLLDELVDLLGVGLRDADLVARVANERFALMLPETTTEGATVVHDRLRKLLDALLAPEEITITVSSGIAYSSDDADGAIALLELGESRAQESAGPA